MSLGQISRNSLDKCLTQNVVNAVCPALRPGAMHEFARTFLSVALNDLEGFLGKRSFPRDSLLKRGQQLLCSSDVTLRCFL